MFLSIASAESASIPINAIKKPASDLLDEKQQPLDAGRAAALAAQGFDLSLLNPVDNKFWQNQSYVAQDMELPVYPAGNIGVHFIEEEAQLPFTYMAKVQSLENPAHYYRFSLSRFSQSTLMRAALLRKLGYYIPSPRYYKDLKLQFRDRAQKEKFLLNAQESLISDFESRNWISHETETSLTFIDAILEPMSNEFFDIHWGYAPNPNNPAQVATVQRLSKYRAYRALLLPYVLVDVPESINRYSPQGASVLSGHIVLQHTSAESFAAASFEDIRWLLRRMQNWTLEDYKQVVRAGNYPTELQELVYRKLLHRTHNLFAVFNLQSPLQNSLPSLDFSSPSGLVVQGKVMREFVENYPQRFAHGDRESPFRDGDLARYFEIRGRTVAIATALNHLNEKLQWLSTTDAVNQRRQDVQRRIQDYIRGDRKQPLFKEVEAWGGPLMGLQLAATRHVTTGTYYGSSAPIQMVDNLSVGMNLGYFLTLEGVPKATPQLGANLQVLRDYTHVRPLLSISEGKKVEWKDLVVPLKMASLAKLLNDHESESPANTENPQNHKDPVDQFLSELREGEVFTISDSVALSSYIQLGSALDVVLGLSPLDFINSLTFGADGARVLLRQTSFMKLNGQIQIFVRDQTTKAKGLTMDVNYFINLLRIRASTTNSDLKTDAFVIDYDPALSELVERDSTEDFAQEHYLTQRKLRGVLKSLFKHNQTELLYANFKYQKFAVDHKLQTRELRKKFLWWRNNSFYEEHTLGILYPEIKDEPQLRPQDEKVTLFSVKRGELIGQDLLGFALDWIGGLFNSKAPDAKINLAQNEDPNPANIPFGKAHWKLVNTQADLSQNIEQLPTVTLLQKVWGGWHLKRNDFQKLIQEVSSQFKETPLANYPLLEPEFFHLTQAIDFYRITAQLSVLPEGLNQIEKLIRQPDAEGRSVKRAKNLERIFQKLSQKLGRPARPHDLEMYEDILKILGNGNFAAGQRVYITMCEEAQQRKYGEGANFSVAGAWIDGTYYDCIEDWMKSLLNLSRDFPTQKKEQSRWINQVLYLLDEKVPMSHLLNYLGSDNYVYFVRINGFRSGDEDGDLEYFSNSLGDPRKDLELANGLIQAYANKTRISPIELDRSQGGFR
ncbi:MAG: hypothetical protein ACLGGX_09285 [Bdellovibrionia bacterium]